MADPQQVTAALPEWQRFLQPILSPRGAKAAIAARRADLQTFEAPNGGYLTDEERGTRHAGFVKKQITLYSAWLSPTAPYPEPDTLWQFAAALRQSGAHWAAGPLMLFAAGRIREFVEVMATFNSRKLTPERLRELLDLLPLAIDGNESARRAWTLINLEREAFAHPEDAAGLFRSPPAPLAVAHALSTQFQIPYGYLRNTVLEYVDKWTTTLGSRP